MVQVSYPGVYIKEVPSGSRTITGVSTSITAFVGATKRGPVNEPVAVLSYSDYVRSFSDDTQVSEMADQVRQFFLNGGQQAYVMRVAHGATKASAVLNSYLTLTARGIGTDGNSLRAVVDYATAEPERTFNLTIYREAIGSTGLGEVVEQETLKALSMDSTNARFAADIINRDSKLCTATATAPASGSTSPVKAGVSVGGRLLTGSTYMAAALALIQASKAAAVTNWQFRITVGGESRVVPVTAAAFADLTGAALAALINGGTGPSATFSHKIAVTFAASTGTVRHTIVFAASTDGDEVRIEPVSDVAADIAALLGWGTAQGGLELGAYREMRPAPNGLVSSASVSALLNIAALAKPTAASQVTLAGPESTLTLSLQPVASWGALLGESVVDGTCSLSNLAAYFERAAADFNSNLNNSSWSAQVQGLRLAFLPTYGRAASGANEGFTAGPAWLYGASGLFAVGAKSTLSRGTELRDGAAGTAAEPSDYRSAFSVLESKVDLFNLLVLPRSFESTADDRAQLWADASAFCKDNRAFLIIDPTTSAVGENATIDAALQAVKDNRLGIVKDHSAMYWPRVIVKPDGARRPIDPCGTIAGLMARIDDARGVWKAPAGTEADLRGVFGVETPMSDRENGRLNPEALNCIRAFNSGIVGWGARTMDGFDNSGNDDYKYVPVRRFALFLEESLYRGLQWAVFEPNDQRLWSQIRMVVGSFMNGLYRQGAFFGETSKEAYFVKVDSETTTPNDINLGICNVVVGFAPVKPAEFIVVTIKQKAGQVQV